MPPPTEPLLRADEPAACITENLTGSSRFVIVVDHAGARIPASLHHLGVSEAELKRHIAWDIGALGLARHMARLLDAPLIFQAYSRLVIDCNRDPAVESSIPTISEHTEVPGNQSLSAEAKQARRAAIFDPYHDTIRSLLEQRQAAGTPTVLVAQHTMTPVYKGGARDMQAAILYNRDTRFAHLTLAALRREEGLHVADNQPYFVSDATDYTIPKHGEGRGLPHVEIEVRQDLVSTEAGQEEWAKRLVCALRAAEQAFFGLSS
jgi:predicted N-formylglutamate amidohydrolase